MAKVTIRAAVAADAALIYQYMNELARYERQPNAVEASLRDVEKLLTEDSGAYALLCLWEDKPIGFAVYFYNYSSWLGKRGLYLEDIYIQPDYRGMGAGKAILKYLAKKAVAKGCGRFEWGVLDWDHPAIEFYESIGAKRQQEWVVYRLSGESLLEVAKE